MKFNIISMLSMASIFILASGSDEQRGAPVCEAPCWCETNKVGAYCGTRTTVFYPGENVARITGNCNPKAVYQCYAANTQALVKTEECPVPCQENNARPGLDICPFFRNSSPTATECTSTCLCDSDYSGSLCGTRTRNLYPNEKAPRLSGQCSTAKLYQCFGKGFAYEKTICRAFCEEHNSNPGYDVCSNITTSKLHV